MELETQVGPITNKPQLEKVLKYIDVAKAEGATALLGGMRASGAECGDGWFVEPTIFGCVNNGMRIEQAEMFRPVLSVLPFQNEAKPLALRNALAALLPAS